MRGAKGRRMHLIVLHTNDLHGQLEALARISSLAALR